MHSENYKAKHEISWGFLSSESAIETRETLLYKDLFENYNKYNHPVENESQHVTVKFDYQLIRIVDVVSHVFTYEYLT